jgi:hypothetical protein
MSSTLNPADGVRPSGVPSYIEARQQAERYARLRARVLVVITLLHLGYFFLPVLPCASCRAVAPLLLWLPPLFAVLALLWLLASVRRWVHRCRHATRFIPLPPLEDEQ